MSILGIFIISLGAYGHPKSFPIAEAAATASAKAEANPLYFGGFAETFVHQSPSESVSTQFQHYNSPGQFDPRLPHLPGYSFQTFVQHHPRRKKTLQPLPFIPNIPRPTRVHIHPVEHYPHPHYPHVNEFEEFPSRHHNLFPPINSFAEYPLEPHPLRPGINGLAKFPIEPHPHPHYPHPHPHPHPHPQITGFENIAPEPHPLHLPINQFENYPPELHLPINAFAANLHSPLKPIQGMAKYPLEPHSPHPGISGFEKMTPHPHAPHPPINRFSKIAPESHPSHPKFNSISKFTPEYHAHHPLLNSITKFPSENHPRHSKLNKFAEFAHDLSEFSPLKDKSKLLAEDFSKRKEFLFGGQTKGTKLYREDINNQRIQRG